MTVEDALEIVCVNDWRNLPGKDASVSACLAAEVINLRRDVRLVQRELHERVTQEIGPMRKQIARIGVLVGSMPSTHGCSRTGEISVSVATLEAVRDIFLETL